jgi:hypothetical protein
VVGSHKINGWCISSDLQKQVVEEIKLLWYIILGTISSNTHFDFTSFIVCQIDTNATNATYENFIQSHSKTHGDLLILTIPISLIPLMAFYLAPPIYRNVVFLAASAVNACVSSSQIFYGAVDCRTLQVFFISDNVCKCVIFVCIYI